MRRRSATSTQAKSGTYSAAATGSTTGGFYQDISGLNSGQTYQVSIWTRADSSTTATMMLWLHDTQGNNTVQSSLSTPGTSWQQVTLNYTANSTGAIRIHLYYGAGSGTVYYDQLLIGPTFSLAYAPFGEVYATSGSTDPAFTGQRQDTVAGLYDFPARQYSTQGRWPTPDPSGLASVSLRDPQTLNRYAYVRNNPLANVDPTGLDCEWYQEYDGASCDDSGGGGGGDGGGGQDPTAGGDPSNSGSNCAPDDPLCLGNNYTPPGTPDTAPPIGDTPVQPYPAGLTVSDYGTFPDASNVYGGTVSLTLQLVDQNVNPMQIQSVEIQASDPTNSTGLAFNVYSTDSAGTFVTEPLSPGTKMQPTLDQGFFAPNLFGYSSDTPIETIQWTFKEYPSETFAVTGSNSLNVPNINGRGTIGTAP